MESPEKSDSSIGRRFFQQRKGYGPVAAIVVFLLAYLTAPLIVAFMASFGAVIFGYEPEEILKESNNVIAVFMILSQAVMLYIVWRFLRTRSVGWKNIGLGRLPKGRDVVLALVVFAAYFVALVVLNLIAGLIPAIDTNQQQQFGLDYDSTIISELVMIFVALVVVAPVVEEIVIRGFLYTGLRAKYTKVVSAIITSVLFGIAHLQLFSGAPPLWIAAIDTAILSLFLVYLREKSGALWSGMIVHAIKNSLAFLALFVVK